MKDQKSNDRILAVYLMSKGFAYSIFEGPMSAVDWGVKEQRSREKNARCLDAVAKLIEQYQPDVLIVEDCGEKGSRRSGRIRRLYRSLATFAGHQSLDVYRYSRTQIRQCFANLGAITKYEIAQTLSKLIPSFAHRLPPARKVWMSEDTRMGIFDAASLAWTYFCRDCASPSSEADSQKNGTLFPT